MNRHLFFPITGVLLIFLQTSVLNLLSMGRINVEISMILVVYAGFRMNLLPGALLSFLLGFFLDCMMGSMSGLFTLVYVCIFFISFRVALHAYIEQTLLIVVFTFFCALLEGLIIVLFYKIIYDINMLDSILYVFLPQSLLVCALSPICFRLFHLAEGYFYDGNPQPAK